MLRIRVSNPFANEVELVIGRAGQPTCLFNVYMPQILAEGHAADLGKQAPIALGCRARCAAGADRFLLKFWAMKFLARSMCAASREASDPLMVFMCRRTLRFTSPAS